MVKAGRKPKPPGERKDKRIRTRESYLPKTAEAKRRQMAGLKQYRLHGAKLPALPSRPKLAPPPSAFKDDVIGFLEAHHYVVETRSPIVLMDFQKDILKDVFYSRPTKNLAVVGQPKKSGKSCLAAGVALWFLCCKPMSETYLLASDIDQSQLVCFDKLVKSIRMNPILRPLCNIATGKGKITYQDSFVQILAPNTSLAGINPSLIIAEELWSWVQTEHKRAWDELTAVPTREENLTWVTSYAGFSEDEDSILWQLYEKGIAQAVGKEAKDPRFYFKWFGKDLYSVVPWVKPTYLPQQKKRLSENAFLRLHCNEWASGLEQFITAEILDQNINPDCNLNRTGNQAVLGLDLGVLHDCSAGAVVGPADGNRLALYNHRVWQPKKGSPVSLQAVKNWILEMDGMYDLILLLYDPSQAFLLAQTLTNEYDINAQPYNQTAQNMVTASQNLLTLLKNRRIDLYHDPVVRSHLLNCGVKESIAGGGRIVKMSSGSKVDFAIALALACMGATELFLYKQEAEIQYLGQYEGF